MAALYRTYRPLDFGHVIGQEAVVRTLRNAIEHDQVRQAYLFAGPRGTGKTSMARILAKALNAEGGPNADFDPTSPIAHAIANGSSLDVIEMDAASQRGIDDVREIRERAVLQPVEGGYKVYIIDEAHQLTTQAWNALLKLIEEPPPHLVFVFCTTDLASVLPTVRSRCQTFVFQRPRLQELVAVLRRVCDGEGIDAPDAALALIARGAHGSFRDAVSTLDQLAAATGSTISVQDVLQLVGGDRGGLALPALRHDRRPRHGRRTRPDRGARRAGAGHRPARHRADRASPPAPARAARRPRARVAPRHRGDARAAPRAGEPAARADGAAPDRPARGRRRRHAPGRRPAAAARARARQDHAPPGRPLARFARPPAGAARGAAPRRRAGREPRSPAAAAPSPPRPSAEPVPRRPTSAPEPLRAAPEPPSALPPLELDQLRDAWQRDVVDAVQERSIPISTLLAEARPVEIRGDTLTIEFAPAAGFHRTQIEDPKNLALLREALYEVTGRRLTVETIVGAPPEPVEPEDVRELSEEDVISLLKDTFDAEEVEER